MNNESHEFSEIIDSGSRLVQASTMKRFLNYVIDVGIFFLVLIGIAIGMAFLAPETLGQFVAFTETTPLADRLLSILLYAVFMGVLEGSTGGITVGKLITGTRAINSDGTSLSFGKGVLRGFARAVPFVIFSAFGNPCEPWQDRWTNTYVIDTRKSETNELGEFED